jgi:hypothetical protein
VRAPAIKVRATALGLPVVQPTKVRTPDFLAWVHEQRADFALVLAYGRIIPPSVLAAVPRGFFNLHASILPRHRGAAPINWAIATGETETGISLMQMEEGLDTGQVYSVKRLPSRERDAGEKRRAPWVPRGGRGSQRPSARRSRRILAGCAGFCAATLARPLKNPTADRLSHPCTKFTTTRAA